MPGYDPPNIRLTSEQERKARRLSIILAAQLPTDGKQALVTIRYMLDLVEGYSGVPPCSIAEHGGLRRVSHLALVQDER